MNPALVVARVPFLPLRVATRLFEAAEPFAELRAILRDEPSILPAIYVASASLYDALTAWLDDPAAPAGTAALRALIYVIRMSARCTPYGLFAGIGEVAIGDDETLRIGANWKTLTRPDMELVLSIARAVSAGTQGPTVRYIANESIMQVGDRVHVVNLHLTNYAVKAGETVAEQRMASMRHTAAVRAVRALSARPIERGELARRLAEQLGESEADAIRFVERMIESGILISEFDVAPLGNPQRRVAKRLKQIDEQTGDAFTDLLDRTDAMDATPVARRTVEKYRALGDAFGELAEAKATTPLHVDLAASFEGTLPTEVLNEVRRAGDMLDRVAQPVELKAYREQFMTRYEGTDRMVPLLELVDPNFGLGSPEGVKPVESIDPKIDRALVRIAANAEHAHLAEVELSDDDVATIFPKPKTDRPRGDRDIRFAVLAESSDALQRGDFRVAVQPMTARATQSMGRFALALGDAFAERMQACARAGNTGNDLTAELVYPTMGRKYNVSTRPSTADAELHIGVGESQEGTTVLTPSDLWVGLDGDRFILWSHSQQRRILVVESHLFVTASASTNVCRFLSLLATQNRNQPTGFRWGAASAFRALPRVTYRKAIISPRTWAFDADELGKTIETASDAIATWRDFWGLPRYVLLVQGDNTLMLDLHSALSARLLHDQAGSAGPLHIEEMLSVPSQLWIAGNGGTHVAEFVSAFPAEPRPTAEKPAAPPVIVANRVRYGPGSPWTYVKFYIDRHATDSFIANDVGALVAQLQDHAVDRWFFLRYADPATHVRVRIHSTANAEAVRRAIATAGEAWLASGRIERFAFDTYNPEYERYGGSELDAVETFWTDDSAACIDILRTLGHEDNDRVAAAATSFTAFLLGTPGADAAVIEHLGSQKRATLSVEDRAVLKAIQGANDTRVSNLGAALQTDDIERRIASILHLHCNRLGVSGEAEQRVFALVRSAALGRRSRTAV